MGILSLYVNEPGMRILLAEDDPNVRTFLVRALQSICPQADIIAVADGRQALQALGTSTVDLIISDHHMPHIRGIDLLHAVRRSWAVPFILLTADGTIAAPALAAGAAYVLEKPFALDDLRRAIAALVPVA